MTEAAWAAARSKNNFLRSQFNHWARRLGAKRAIVAMAHSILTIVYHILKDGQPYHDLGSDFLDQRRREAIRRNAERRLLALDFDVQISDRRAA